MSFADTPIVKPTKPVKQKPVVVGPRQFATRFAIGFTCLFATVFVVTSVKRVMGHSIHNSSLEQQYESKRALYAAVDNDPGIGIVLLLIWAVGLFLAGYLASRKLIDVQPMIVALTAAVVALWMIPSLYIQGGILGGTTAIRMLTILPLIGAGALYGRTKLD